MEKTRKEREKLKREILSSIVFALALLLLASSANVPFRKVEASPTLYGPRAPGLTCTQYATYDAAWAAFAAGQEDYFGGVLRAQRDASFVDPEIVLQPHMGMNYMEESFMENETVPFYSGHATEVWVARGLGNPLSVDAFKKALLHLANRDKWVAVIYEGLAERCDAQIPVPGKSWWNPAVTGGNYPFPYDPVTANKLLDHSVEFFDMFHISSDVEWTPESGIGTVIIPGVHYDGGEILLTLAQPVVEIEHVYALLPNGTSIVLVSGTDYIYGGGRTVRIIRPGLPESTYLMVEYIGNYEEHFHVPEVSAPGIITLSHPVSDVVRVRTAERELEEGTEWVWHVSTRNVEILISLPDCTDIWVEYWFGFLDLDGDGVRNFPHGWLNAEEEAPGIPEDIPPLLYYCYNTPATREAVARDWIADMNAAGIQVDLRVRPSSVINTVCFTYYSYQITSDGWAVGRYPDQYMWFFHSWMWAPGYGGYNAYTPGHADLDYAGEHIFYASNIQDFYYWVQMAQFLHLKKYALSNQWATAKTFLAYRNLLGMVYTAATGLWTTYSQLGMYRADNPYANIRVALYPPVTQLNPVYTMWALDRFVLGLVMEDVVNLNPWDIMTEQPGHAKDWEGFEWVDPDTGETKFGVRYWLRTDVKWVKWDTATSSVVEVAPETPRDTQVSDWYLFQTPDAWWHSAYMDIHHIKTTSNMIEYYFDGYALIWLLDFYPWAGHMAPQAYKQAPLGTLETKWFVVDENFTNPLDLPVKAEGAPFDIVYVKKNGGLLTEYTDYNIVKGQVYIFATVNSGDVIEIQYWARGTAVGDTPGGLDWRLTVGIGNAPWVMKEFYGGAGGQIVFVRNPFTFWETPPYGETDWKWYWNPPTGPKPRGGYFWINIYDVVLMTGSYESQGRRIPDPYWYAGADFAPGPYDPADKELKPGLPPTGPGKIDIFDIVALTGNYDTKFQITPPG